MASMTKAEFASLVRHIQSYSNNSGRIESALEDLSTDLGYIEALARAIPEDKLKELEAKGEETFW